MYICIIKACFETIFLYPPFNSVGYAFNNNNNFKFIGQIATYEINNIFTDCTCTNNQIRQSCIHKMDKLDFAKMSLPKKGFRIQNHMIVY